MTDAELRRECGALCRFLVGQEPSPYVVETYLRAHAAQPVLTPDDRFDAFLVRLGSSRLLRRPAAAFSRLFRPHGALQCKLVVLLAILESSAPSHRLIDAVPHTNPVVLVGRLALSGVGGLGALLIGIVVCTPAGWVLRGRRPEG